MTSNETNSSSVDSLRDYLLNIAPDAVDKVLTFTILDNSVFQWLIAFTVILVFLFIRKRLARATVKPLDVIETKSQSVAGEYVGKVKSVLERPLELAISLLGIYIASTFLAESQALEETLTHLYRSVLILLATWVIYRAVNIFKDVIIAHVEKLELDLGKPIVNMVATVIKVITIIMGVLAAVQEWGFNTTQIIALGSVLALGISVSSQDTIKNFWGSMVLFFDKPFKIGDWITVGDVDGDVEHIGLRSSTIRTFAKTTITVPNEKLANSNILNWSRMPVRRIKMFLGVDYNTTPDRMEAILKDIREYLNNHPEVSVPHKVRVYFSEFADSSLNIMCYYFTKTTNWDKWMEIREEHYLEFMRIVERHGSSIAFPTQSVYIESVPRELQNLGRDPISEKML